MLDNAMGEEEDAYAAEEVFLEVELSSTWAFCFNNFENLLIVRVYSSFDLVSARTGKAAP